MPDLSPFGAVNPFSPPADTPPLEVPRRHPRRCREAPVPAVPVSPTPPPLGAGEPPGSFPSIPGMNMTDVGPDHNDPFPNRSFADIVTSVEEAPTGRFMIGVGANSFQGLIGNIQINEKNFDIYQHSHARSPTSSTARRSAAAGSRW